MKIDYSKYTFQELIDRIELARFFDLPRMTREALKRLKALIDAIDVNEPKYKVYTALMSQSETSNPIVVVLGNNIGSDIVWTRLGVGDYRGQLTNPSAFENKNIIIPQNNNMIVSNSVEYNRAIDSFFEDTYIVLNVRSTDDPSVSLDNLIDTFPTILFEIRVYN